MEEINVDIEQLNDFLTRRVRREVRQRKAAHLLLAKVLRTSDPDEVMLLKVAIEDHLKTVGWVDGRDYATEH